MEEQEREFNSLEEFVEKAIDTKVKARFQPLSIQCEINKRCSCGNQLAYFSVAKSEASSTQDP